jgi:predicted secreted acid phosphatase
MSSRFLRPLTAVLLLLALAACRTVPTAPAAPAEPPNLSALKEELRAYADDGRYAAGVARVADEARAWIETRARAGGGRLAIVLDIDETVLSNLSHMREWDFGYHPPTWDRWVEAADGTPIEPMREVYRAARAAGVAVFFLTGRKTTDGPGTIENLRATGMGDYAGLHLKPNGYPGTTQAFKTETRRALEAEGWTIIANVGDQQSDLDGGHAERTFKLPNPFYLTK